jgi:hypothetical protein
LPVFEHTIIIAHDMLVFPLFGKGYGILPVEAIVQVRLGNLVLTGITYTAYNTVFIGQRPGPVNRDTGIVWNPAVPFLPGITHILSGRSWDLIIIGIQPYTGTVSLKL